MIELKVYKPYANRDGDVLIYHKGDEDLMLDDEDEIYLKEDADKVIAHHKYKRCLAMARICRLRGRLFGACGLYEKELWALKWHKRWLELAEKFKEAK